MLIEELYNKYFKFPFRFNIVILLFNNLLCNNQWSSSAGWENQEVAPRCELDRNQYLETGQFIESTEVQEVPLETETNEEGNL